MNYQSINFRINAGYAALVGLLLVLGGFSYFSVSRMADSLKQVSQGIVGMRSDLQQTVIQMASLEESVQILQQSQEEFDKLQELQGTLEESQAATSLIRGGLEEVQHTFSAQSETLQSIGSHISGIAAELKVSSDNIQKLILSAEGINTLMLQSYIGFFNYLNEYAADVDTPLENIQQIYSHLKQVSELLEPMPGVEGEKALVTEINQSLRRYRRYMRDLGETTSTTQISELKEPLVKYGNQIMQAARQLRDRSWQIADRQTARSLEVAAKAEDASTQALAANIESATTLNNSVELAIASSGQIGQVTSRLSKALAAVEHSLGKIPATLERTTEALNEFKASTTVMDETMAAAQLGVKSSEEIRIFMVSVCLGAVMFGLFFCMFVYRKIASPLARFTQGLHQAAENDLSIQLQASGTRGELRSLMVGMNRLIETFRTSVVGTRTLAQQVVQSSRHLNALAGESLQNLEDQNHRTARISSATEQMSAMTSLIATNTAEAKRQSGQVSDLAAQGNQAIGQMLKWSTEISLALDSATENINDLATDSEKINSIISIIDGITNMTNLLALNAAVEAARAGQHGKGFAVVADEVKQLAHRTAEATRNISDIVLSVQAKIAPTVEEMTRCRETSGRELVKSKEVAGLLQQVDSSMVVLKKQIEEIAQASKEEAQAFPEIASSLETINQITVSTSEKMQRVTDQALGLVQLSEDLLNKVGCFKTGSMEKSPHQETLPTPKPQIGLPR